MPIPEELQATVEQLNERGGNSCICCAVDSIEDGKQWRDEQESAHSLRKLGNEWSMCVIGSPNTPRAMPSVAQSTKWPMCGS